MKIGRLEFEVTPQFIDHLEDYARRPAAGEKHEHLSKLDAVAFSILYKKLDPDFARKVRQRVRQCETCTRNLREPYMQYYREKR